MPSNELFFFSGGFQCFYFSVQEALQGYVVLHWDASMTLLRLLLYCLCMTSNEFYFSVEVFNVFLFRCRRLYKDMLFCIGMFQ